MLLLLVTAALCCQGAMAAPQRGQFGGEGVQAVPAPVAGLANHRPHREENAGQGKEETRKSVLQLAIVRLKPLTIFFFSLSYNLCEYRRSRWLCK